MYVQPALPQLMFFSCCLSLKLLRLEHLLMKLSLLSCRIVHDCISGPNFCVSHLHIFVKRLLIENRFLPPVPSY